MTQLTLKQMNDRPLLSSGAAVDLLPARQAGIRAHSGLFFLIFSGGLYGMFGGMFGGCAAGENAKISTTTASTMATNAKCGQKGTQEGGVLLQVLGSGGPIPDDARASSGYVVWHDGKSRVLVDVGGGIFPRFGASGAKLMDLDVVALSHLHVDHAGGLPSLLKGAYFSRRHRVLPLVGPSGNDSYPATDDFLSALVDPQRGAFRYLSGVLTGKGIFKIEPVVVDVNTAVSVAIFRDEHVLLEAIGVHHGHIPALGFLLTIDGQRIAFAGDQSATDQAGFAALITDVDVLVVHHAIPEKGAERIVHLHASPSQLGQLAASAKVKKLVLSHHMQRSLTMLPQSLAAIQTYYKGPIVVANDLDCISLL